MVVCLSYVFLSHDFDLNHHMWVFLATGHYRSQLQHHWCLPSFLPLFKCNIFVLTLLYTKYQNSISTGVLFILVNDSLQIIIFLSIFPVFSSKLLIFLVFFSVLSFQFVQCFITNFYWFGKVYELVFTFNLVILSYLIHFVNIVYFKHNIFHGVHKKM